LKAQDAQNINVLVELGITGWYNLRITLTAVFAILMPTYLLVIYYFDNLTLAYVSVAIYIGSGVSGDINEWLWQYASVESSMIAVERCHHFEKIEPEPQYKSYKEDFKIVDGSKSSIEQLKRNQLKNSETVVTEGRIEFSGMSCKYATSQQPVLNKLSFEVRPREKIGVIGRTGSGKSTLIKLLWRALDFFEGDIKIDGKSIKEVDLKSLRSQITIVTQETALIEGTLRENIDIRLTDKSRDSEIEKILDRLGFANQNYAKKRLDMQIDADGSNLSAGEKQLISFARTLLDKKKIMVLDEATANIDLKTEENIQKCIKEDFTDTTMLIIAHRIQTIMDCDRILVLEKGKIAALDTPANLQKDADGYFMTIINKMKE
jgi:ABC-type multidrug transport system fused ATPase/permease subunit